MLPSTRQDAWTKEEDVILANIVLRHIREGSTQLRAFEEVGAELSRTAAACGFRWNSYVRKLYKLEIDEAKDQRKHYKKQSLNLQTEKLTNKENKLENRIEDRESNKITFQDVILYLEQLYKRSEQQFSTIENERLLEKITELEIELNRLEKENEVLINKFLTLKETYTSVQPLIDKARNVPTK